MKPLTSTQSHAALALAIAVVLGVGCSRDAQDQTATIEAKPLESVVLLSGQIRTAQAIELLAPQVGMWPIPIQSILEDGTAVKAGQSIAEFDSSNLASGLEQNRDRVVDAESTYLITAARLDAEAADARFEVESKRLALEKTKVDAAIPEGLKPEREYQTLQLSLRRAELELDTASRKLANQLAKAQAELGITQVEVSKARTEVARTEQSLEVVTLTAPRDGVLEIAFNRDEGRPFRSGDNAQPGVPVARFPDYCTLRVEANLFDVDEGTVEIGAQATVVLDAFPNRPFTATVTEIQEVAQQTSSRSARRVFRLIANLEQPDAEIMKVGMSARVEIRSELAEWHGQPTLVVKREAMRFTGRPRTAGAASADDVKRTTTVTAQLKTPTGWIDAEVGRCSTIECIVLGPEAGTRVTSPAPALATESGS